MKTQFLGICLTDECRRKKMEDECTAECTGDQCTKEAFDACMVRKAGEKESKKEKTEKTFSTVQEILEWVAAAKSKNQSGTTSPLPDSSSGSLVLGMQPAIGYTVIALLVVGVSFGGYKLVKKLSK